MSTLLNALPTVACAGLTGIPMAARTVRGRRRRVAATITANADLPARRLAAAARARR